MHNNRFRFTVRKKLILAFTLILLVPSLTVGLLAYDKAKDSTEQQLLDKAEENTMLLNNMIEDSLKPQIDNLNVLTKQVSSKWYQGKESKPVRSVFDQYKAFHPDIDSLYVGTETGLIIQSPQLVKDPNFDPRSRQWYKDAMNEKGKVILTEPYADAASGNMMVTIAQAVQDGSGVIGIDVQIDAISEMAAKVSVGKKGHMILLDKSKKVVSHPTEKPGSEAKDVYYDKLYDQDSGSVSYTDHGQDKKMVFATNKLTGWKIAGAMDADEVSDTARPILNYILITLILAFAAGGVLCYFIIRSIVSPLRQLNDSALKISSGDLTEQIDVHTEDELGDLSTSFNEMSGSLRKLIQEVDISAEQVAASAEQLTASSEQTAATAQQLSAGVQQVASGAEAQEAGIEKNASIMQEIAQGVSKVAESALSVSDHTKKAALQAEAGGESVLRSVEQMQTIHDSVTKSNTTIQSLHERSKEIEGISDTIAGIADQTNLLALNAAIEAARAGESGKGFAVVADEVRKLAEQSQQSAMQISSLIGTIQNDTTESVQAMQTAAEKVADGLTLSKGTQEQLSIIMNSVENIAPQVEDVAAIAEQIAASIQDVVVTAEELVRISKENAAASDEMANSTEEQLASMEEITSAAKSLTTLSEELHNMLSVFKV